MLFAERLFGPHAEAAWMQVFLVIFSVCCHEYAHAWVALWQGDSTAADEGHLTLNPMRQMGIMSLLLLAFLGIAWGAVPVNPARMKHRYSEVLVSFAGPAMNLLLFLAMGLAGFLTVWKMGQTPVAMFMMLGAELNIFLFLFNMIPIPPLDGYAVGRHFLPGLFRFESEFSKGLMLLAVFGLFMFSKYFYYAGEAALQGYFMALAAVLRMLGIES